MYQMLRIAFQHKLTHEAWAEARGKYHKNEENYVSSPPDLSPTRTSLQESVGHHFYSFASVAWKSSDLQMHHSRLHIVM